MKRGKKSTVGTHPKLAQIHEDLSKEVPIRQISTKYQVSIQALYRYLRHLPENVEKIRTAAEIARGDRILQLVVFLQDKLMGILDKAEKEGKDATGISAIRACLDNLQFHAKLTGKVPAEGPAVAVQVNLVEMAEWSNFKRVLLVALAPFREARLAAAQAMMLEERRLESKTNVVQ